MNVVEKIKHELRKYGVIVPKQINTIEGLKSYLDARLKQERASLDNLYVKLELKKTKIQVIGSALQELKLYIP